MKKSGFKTLMAVTAMTVGIMGTAVNAYAEAERLVPENNFVSPYYVAISKTSGNLSDSGNGKLACTAQTIVSASYTAEVEMELQKQVGTRWTKVYLTSKKSVLTAKISETRSVDSGYSYRLKTTHRAYDSDGNLIEETTSYSSVVSI